MKKIIAFVFVMVVAFAYSIPCFAESENHNVYAKYVESDAYSGRDIAKGGIASVTLPDGIIVTVSGIPSDDYLLYVKEFTDNDKSAMQWFSQLIPNQSNVFYPFYICLFDGNKKIIPENDVDVEISFPITRTYKAFFLDTDGNVTPSDCNLKNNIVSFKSKLNAYSVIVPYENQSLSPKTGDMSEISFWLVTLIVSSMCFIACCTFSKKRIK